MVFSAGLGNVIELVLEKEGLLYDNVKVASNFMNFNEDVRIVEFFNGHFPVDLIESFLFFFYRVFWLASSLPLSTLSIKHSAVLP